MARRANEMRSVLGVDGMERGIRIQARETDRHWDWEALGRLVREAAQELAGRQFAELGGVVALAETGIAVSLERDAS